MGRPLLPRCTGPGYTSSVLLGPGEVHEAAGIHRTYRQRCSRVATCSARAAGGEPTIGYLGATTPSAESQRVAALVQRLRAFGWIESRNLTISVCGGPQRALCPTRG